jgi:hypothetical protein
MTMGHGEQDSSAPGLRVIFLDVDGVICCNRVGHLEEAKLRTLREVVDRTGAHVVLSTDWRRAPKLKERLQATLHQFGIRCIGATQQLDRYMPVRPREIVSWLEGYESQRTRQSTAHPPVSTWVAIDDRYLLAEEQGERPTPRFSSNIPHNAPHHHGTRRTRLMNLREAPLTRLPLTSHHLPRLPAAQANSCVDISPTPPSAQVSTSAQPSSACAS